MGYFYLVIAAVTLYCIIGAETQHRWGPWVDRITSSSRKG